MITAIIKTMQKIFLCSAIILSSLSAQEAVFEIKNDSKNPIWISLGQPNTFSEKEFTTIYETPPIENISTLTDNLNKLLSPKISGAYIYQLNPGKSIAVKSSTNLDLINKVTGLYLWTSLLGDRSDIAHLGYLRVTTRASDGKKVPVINPQKYEYRQPLGGQSPFKIVLPTTKFIYNLHVYGFTPATPSRQYHLTRKKNIILIWNGKELKAQKPTIFSKKSALGYELKDNITDAEIYKINTEKEITLNQKELESFGYYPQSKRN